jgi:hypothetical protein
MATIARNGLRPADLRMPELPTVGDNSATAPREELTHMQSGKFLLDLP